MFETYEDDGLRILGFPCNQFADEEPGTNSEIEDFCRTKYGVSFDLFSKIDVKGENQAPLYRWLTSEHNPWGPHKVRWNFQKYIVDRKGRIVDTFDPMVEPRGELFEDRLREILGQGRDSVSR